MTAIPTSRDNRSSFADPDSFRALDRQTMSVACGRARAFSFFVIASAQTQASADVSWRTNRAHSSA
jgi:hypothetical protein